MNDTMTISNVAPSIHELRRPVHDRLRRLTDTLLDYTLGETIAILAAICMKSEFPDIDFTGLDRGMSIGYPGLERVLKVCDKEWLKAIVYGNRRVTDEIVKSLVTNFGFDSDGLYNVAKKHNKSIDSQKKRVIKKDILLGANLSEI